MRCIRTYLAWGDPRIPWHAKVVIVLTVAYALSPIDLIPDFIPVIGFLDDLIIVPAGIALAISLMPDNILEEYRERAKTELQNKKINSWVGLMIVVPGIIFLGKGRPTRCSRDTAKVAMFRLASSHPDSEPGCS